MSKQYKNPVLSKIELPEECPEAFFCCSDAIALNVVQHFYRARKFIPDTFSVVGFGNTISSAYSSPPLTTIDEPYYDTGVAGCKRLVHLIETAEASVPHKFIGRLIIRESTAPSSCSSTL